MGQVGVSQSCFIAPHRRGGVGRCLIVGQTPSESCRWVGVGRCFASLFNQPKGGELSPQDVGWDVFP